VTPGEPVTGPVRSRPPGRSSLTETVVSTTSFFFDVAGNGFFAMLLFVILVARFWRPPLAERLVGRNEPCPCGSGKKAKRCCQAGLLPV
jgi:uncharacterized protein YecA (UPF0149 family)